MKLQVLTLFSPEDANPSKYGMRYSAKCFVIRDHLQIIFKNSYFETYKYAKIRKFELKYFCNGEP